MEPSPNLRRIAALHLPYLATERVRRLRAATQRCLDAVPAEAPLVTTRIEKNALRLEACDAAAHASGLRIGMTLADARAMYPALDAVAADPAAEAALLSAIADWCRRFTPLVGEDRPDVIFLDIGGSAHLFGGEKALMREIASGLARQGLTARVAIAGTPEAAAALARAGHSIIVHPGEEEKALRPLPIAALRPEPDAVEALAKVGLTRIEDLVLRPRAPLAARFGEALLARLDAALGRIRSSLAARLEAAPYLAERRFAEPILTQDDVARTLAGLASEISRLLAAHDEGARRLEATLFRADGHVRRIEVATSRPQREAALLARLFAEKLTRQDDALDIGYGFDVVRLAVLEAAPLAAAAPRLDAAPGEADMARLVDLLGARLGARCVLRLEARDSHWPEAAMAFVPYAAAVGAGAMPLWNPTRRRGEASDRPILLLPRPEPIEAIAEVPDGPPRRFRWRRVLHDIAAIEGPERIAAQWWKAEARTRDYFRTEDREGRRFWLFREGLYGRETSTPAWFLHGLFG